MLCYVMLLFLCCCNICFLFFTLWKRLDLRKCTIRWRHVKFQHLWRWSYYFLRLMFRKKNLKIIFTKTLFKNYSSFVICRRNVLSDYTWLARCVSFLVFQFFSFCIFVHRKSKKQNFIAFETELWWNVTSYIKNRQQNSFVLSTLITTQFFEIHL